MENLYIETENGKKPIKQEIINKYNLEKGLISPFTREPVINQNGEFPSELKAEKDPKNTGGKLKDTNTEDVILSTSEIIDFAQGTDSSTVHR